MIKVKPVIYERLKDLEKRKGGDYQYADIADATGLSRHTVKTVFTNTVTRIDLSTLGAILTFFRDEDMPLGIEQLFELDPPLERVTVTRADGGES